MVVNTLSFLTMGCFSALLWWNDSGMDPGVGAGACLLAGGFILMIGNGLT